MSRCPEAPLWCRERRKHGQASSGTRAFCASTLTLTLGLFERTPHVTAGYSASAVARVTGLIMYWSGHLPCGCTGPDQQDQTELDADDSQLSVVSLHTCCSTRVTAVWPQAPPPLPTAPCARPEPTPPRLVCQYIPSQRRTRRSTTRSAKAHLDGRRACTLQWTYWAR